jgi:hypothetical protein
MISGGDPEQFSDEVRLCADIVSADVSNLPLPDHRDRLKGRQRSSCCPEAAKAKTWSGQTFYAPVVLLHNGVYSSVGK